MVEPAALDAARKQLTDSEKIRSALVVGAGWVGRQIVLQLSAFGIKTIWLDQSPEALNNAVAWLNNQGESIRVEQGWKAVNEPLGPSVLAIHDISQARDDIDLVIESVTEQSSAKRKVLTAVSQRFPNAIIASNSSYFTPSVLQRFVSNPERFAHFHFHVPVWKTKLVDIAACPDTCAKTLVRLEELSTRIDQKPLVQLIENPGYVFNWMLKSLIQSSLQLVQRQVTTPEKVDMAWKSVTGMVIGPFGMMDQIGLDLVYQTMAAGRFVDGDDVWSPLMELLEPYIQAGKLGVKTGSGFYCYQDPQ
ncbi:MAG: 3-hydroxyacyl-CoA dehydrogenase NAD-binding domain-containing protein [Pirellula sp.]|jgi:3-hydroxybutyryl-CoA dehydrogenase|nr:3-hydroxyacyl-CoA dehydrogenase NAD-binding domain-containing protein [Pirellula sp.]